MFLILYLNHYNGGEYIINIETKAVINVSYFDIVDSITVNDANSYYTNKDDSTRPTEDFVYESISVTKEDIIRKFYIIFNKTIICGDIMKTEDYLFILYHYHTGNHVPDKDDIVYLEQHDGYIMHCKYLTEVRTEAHKLIVDLIRSEREFYINKEVGEVVRNRKLNVTHTMIA